MLNSARRDKLLKRLVFSAKTRCQCGAGMAYDPRARQPVWDCSAILLGDALVAGEHGACDHSSPCQYFEVTSERSLVASGATTRPDAN